MSYPAICHVIFIVKYSQSDYEYRGGAFDAMRLRNR